MKRRLFFPTAIAAVSTAACALCLIGCGEIAGGKEQEQTEHVHSYSQEWEYDSSGHWHECTAPGNCDAKEKDWAKHDLVGGECSICDYSKSSEPDVPTHTHSLTKKDSLSPTCVADGNIEYWICGDCGKFFSGADGETEITDKASVTLGATGVHTYTDYVYNNDATCKADGTETAKCDNCAETDTKTKAGTKLAHSFTNYVYNNDATCKADGTETAQCGNCDETDTKIKAGTKLAHTFTNYVYNNDATCGKDGTETAKCDNCVETDTKTKAGTKLAHTFTNYVYNNDATCGKDGTETAQCGNCDETDTRDSAEHPATNEHTYENYECTVCGDIDPDKYATQGLEYELDGDGYKVVGIGTATDTDIVIPTRHNGEPVTGIRYGAFSQCNDITSVKLPDGVTSIGDRAFYYCTNLTEINISKNTTAIGFGAFEGCGELTEISIPDGVTDIGAFAFAGCVGLNDIVIPSSVSNVGKGAFLGCSGLVLKCKAAEAPSGWDRNWNDGKWKDLPVIWNCDNNDKDENGYGYAVIDGILYGLKDGAATVAVQSSKIKGNVTVPSSVLYNEKSYTVTAIDSSAFNNCEELTGIDLPNTVTVIGGSAFLSCNSLKRVNIPGSVNAVEGWTFKGCSNLSSVTIGDGVSILEDQAFSGCVTLTSITIPVSVTTIESRAFDSCYVLTISCEAAEAPSGWASDWYKYGWGDENCPVIWDCKNNDQDGNGYAYPVIDGIRYKLRNGEACVENNQSGIKGDLTIPSSVVYKNTVYSVTGINSEAFDGCSELTGITIPDSITSVGDNVFRNCTGLIRVSWAEGFKCERIDAGAFYGCTALKRVTVPIGVKKIDIDAFYGCTGLTEITIPDSVTKIGNNAFYGCTGLTGINIPNGVTSIGNGAFYGCSGLAEIAIPDGVTEIGTGAFYGCSGLTSVEVGSGNSVYHSSGNCIIYTTDNRLVLGCRNSVIPDGVMAIESGAFFGCTGLTEIVIPDGVTVIGSEAFLGCTGLTGELTIPDGVASIGSNAFAGCSALTSITIPNGVTEIGSGAFSDCKGLTDITLPDSVTIIGSYAFSGCTGLATILVPSGVTEIGNGAFSGCSGLMSVEVESGNSFYHRTGNCIIETANNYLVVGCPDCVIPDGVTDIGSGAFAGLTSITIPSSVTNIWFYAFANCYKLRQITYTGTVEQWKQVSIRWNWKDYIGTNVIHCSDGDYKDVSHA